MSGSAEKRKEESSNLSRNSNESPSSTNKKGSLLSRLNNMHSQMNDRRKAKGAEPPKRLASA